MRVSLGASLTVTTTEIWLSEVRAGRAFIRGASVAAVAAQLSHLQLFNPAASPVTLIVRAATFSSNAADNLEIRTHNAALPTLISAGVNLLSGGAAGNGELRSTNNAAAQGTLAGSISVAGSTPFNYASDWLFELGPGEGILVNNASVNLVLNGVYLWREVA